MKVKLFNKFDIQFNLFKILSFHLIIDKDYKITLQTVNLRNYNNNSIYA